MRHSLITCQKIVFSFVVLAAMSAMAQDHMLPSTQQPSSNLRELAAGQRVAPDWPWDRPVRLQALPTVQTNVGMLQRWALKRTRQSRAANTDSLRTR